MRATKSDDRVYIHCPACDEPHGPKVEPLGHPGSWAWNGSLDRPTFTPSLLCRWEGLVKGKEIKRVCHLFITDGRIQFLSDCTHALAGQTVDLPEV